MEIIDDTLSFLHLDKQFIYYLLVGIPTVLGIWWRVKTYGDYRYVVTFKITLAIFSSLAVGYIFFLYGGAGGKEQSIYLSNWAPIFSAYGCWLLYQYIFKERVYFGILSALAIMFFASVAHGAILSSNSEQLIMVYLAVLIISLALVIGAIHAILGPVISGFNISVFVYGFFLGEQYDLAVWAGVLDAISISNIYVQSILVGLSTIIGMSGSVNIASSNNIFSGLFK